KLDGSRANERKMLGAEMAKYGNYLGQFGSVPDSAKIKSYFHSARKFGIWAPDEVNINRAEKLIADYLKNVGTLLRDEQKRTNNDGLWLCASFDQWPRAQLAGSRVDGCRLCKSVQGKSLRCED